MPTLTPEEVARRYRQAKERRAPWESHWAFSIYAPETRAEADEENPTSPASSAWNWRFWTGAGAAAGRNGFRSNGSTP